MKKLGIGYEFYKRIIDDNCYYVDKTLLIRDIIEQGGMVTLFNRPRRFGKTLALSMLQTFFEAEYDLQGNPVDNRRYFEGKKIMEADEGILSRLGQYPVIFLTLKSAKQDTFENAFFQLEKAIVDEVSRHSYLLDSDKLTDIDKETFRSWLDFGIEPYSTAPAAQERLNENVGRFSTVFAGLSKLLKKHHGKGVIIMYDEYDVPLENSYFAGFYDRMVRFIRSLFESSLKTNTALEFAVITGCLRISKESIFTELNHLVVNTVRSDTFGEYFGFTQEETDSFLTAYGLEDKIPEVKEWYDGYLFGDKEVYNPWSVIQYINNHRVNHDRLPEAYWSNTSSNSIIKDLVYNADPDVKEELDLLISGGTIEKQIHEDITYEDINTSEDNLWNFLFFTGYMKKVSERSEDDNIFLTMCIPNREIRSIYSNQMRSWFKQEVVDKTDRSVLHRAILSKDTGTAGRFVTELLKKSISTFDSLEGFYHGFLVSLLIGITDYETRSNREEGNGRPDITLYPMNPKDPAYIFEIKVRRKFNQMDDGIKEAFTQIRDMKYEEGILDDGYAGVISFGVCFCKKSCIIELIE